MARIVVWFWVLVVALVAQTQNSDKVDVKTFLENIKKMFQETVEKMRKQQENRMKRRKDKKNKIKTKKMIINKLANPYLSFRRQHAVINVNSPSNRDNLQDNNNRIDVNTGRIPPQTVNKVLRANPVFNPFRTDRLKDILSKIQRPQSNVQGNVQNSSTSSGNTEPDPQILRYERELYNWLDEVYSKIDWFWDIVYRLFILDENRFEYLSKVLCKGEITTPSSWWYNSSVDGCSSNNLPNRFKVIRLDNSTNMPCNSLDPHKLKVNTNKLGEIIACMEHKLISSSIDNSGQCVLSLYTKAKLIGNKKQQKVLKAEGIRPAYTSHKSLCYNLAALNFFGYKRDLYHNYDSSYISSEVSSFIQYVQFMERIYKEKIIPAISEMCYVWCLCEDLGIKCTKQQKELSQEEMILFMVWNLRKADIEVLIESLSKFENGINRISGDCSQIKNEFKEIIKLDYIQDKLPKLKELKNKIDEMESSGKIDTSYYEDLLKLAGEVKSKLSDVKEPLIKLWKEKIEKIETVGDLKCVLDSFKTFIEYITVNNKNVLELYFNNLISLVKEKLWRTLRKLVDQVGTLDDVTKWLYVSMLLKNAGYELKDIIESDSSPKTKGLSRFINMVGGDDTLYVSFQEAWNLNHLLKWVSTLDYSIYVLITLFNNLKCTIGNVTMEGVLGYLEESLKKISPNDRRFLQCFMSGGTIKQCAGDRYGIIEVIIGDVTIDSLGNLKDRIDELNKYEKLEDIPTVKGCCDDSCRDFQMEHVITWCNALTSPTFKKCCRSPLRKCCASCNPSAEPFCLNDDFNKVKEQCNSSDIPSIAMDGSPCKNLFDKLKSLFSISYNNNTRKIFCDVVEKYDKFCEEDYKFINDIKDSRNTSVMANAGYVVRGSDGEMIFIKYGELKCGCLKCSAITQAGIIRGKPLICEDPISINYTERVKMERFLQRIGLLEEAKKAIEGGLLKNLGSCPSQ